MNTDHQIFSWSRFTDTLRKEFVENGRTLSLVLLAIYLYFTIELVINNYYSNGLSKNVHDPVFFLLFIAIITSLGFSGLTSKSKRTDYLANSSSTVEKFTANTLIYVIGSILAITACSFLADFTRIAILWFHKSETFFVPGPTAFINTVVKWVNPESTFAACFPDWLYYCFWITSIYMVGSIMWPKKSILKTSVPLIAYFIIFAVIGIVFFKKDGMTENANDILLKIFRYINYAIIVVCWVGGWFLFKGKDIISRKWWA